jgi:hypothetical protein
VTSFFQKNPLGWLVVFFSIVGVAFEPAKLGFYGEKTEIKTTSQVDFLIIRLILSQ